MEHKFHETILESSSIENKIKSSIDTIIDSYDKDFSVDHINKYPLPSKEAIIGMTNDLFDVLYPGYYTETKLNKANIKYYLGNKITEIFATLSSEIAKSFRHEDQLDIESCDVCDNCIQKGIDASLTIIESIPRLRKLLSYDLQAAYQGDPAAKSINEIVFSYPGMSAITVHRIAHELYLQNIPLIPRIMSEYSHSRTGIDIHPGAKISEYFFIDHATGVVIGETCKIGKNVKIYQGVTLGARSFPKDKKGKLIKGLQRHPTIEDNVTIYSNATILGGETVIGENCVIGGNVWITESIPANSQVVLNESQRTPTIKNYTISSREKK
jgi:serine O-acetyltransferase